MTPSPSAAASAPASAPAAAPAAPDAAAAGDPRIAEDLVVLGERALLRAARHDATLDAAMVARTVAALVAVIAQWREAAR